ncbi:unnamed protein product [Coregonus sp. 'balchen']|nr:unnamed protein product [Coregonus sp. 'balchen']
MWGQEVSHPDDAMSQLLSATFAREVFGVGDVEVNQVSVSVPPVTNVLYSVDDVTGPPLDVKLWVYTADPCVDSTFVPPGTYVKVSGSLRIIQGQRSLVAFNLLPYSKPRGINLQELHIKLDYLSMTVINQSLEFLISKGHIFSTIDDKHFKSTTG